VEDFLWMTQESSEIDEDVPQNGGSSNPKITLILSF
jgi:hypothetical protein